MNERNYESDAKLVKKLYVFAFGFGTVIAILFIIWGLMENVSPSIAISSGLALGLIFWGMGLAFRIYAKSLEKKALMQKENVEEEIETPPETLFLLCRNENVIDLNSTENLARMKLIASNNNILEDEATLVKLFETGKKIIEEYENVEKLNALIDEERIIIENSTRYIEYVGRDKIIAMCRDKIAEQEEIIRECEGREEILRSGGSAYYKDGAQKESSWALHGGVASALAGGAAGVATAIRVQQNNETKRRYNQHLSNFVASTVADGIIKLGKVKSEAADKIRFWEEKISEAEKKLIEELPAEFLMEKLRPEFISIEKRETGSLLINIKTQPTPGILIYDTVAAVVDGTIKAIVKKDGIKVGEAYFSLPYDGAWNLNKMISVCPDLREVDNYDLEFEPVSLWAVETNLTIRIPEATTEEEAEERRKQELERARALAEKKENEKRKREFSSQLPDFVLDVLRKNGKKTMEELLEDVPEWAEVSKSRMLVVINGLLKSNLIVSNVENDITYYQC